MKNPYTFTLWLTFDDVLLLPGEGAVKRNDVSLDLRWSNDIKLTLPILSAAMDTVTEGAMAESLARAGGLGIIHRNNLSKDQAREVERVKRSRVLCGAAIGPHDTERASLLKEAGCDVFVIDVASCHNRRVLEGAAMVKKTIAKRFLILGNVATKEGAKAASRIGDAVKVGVGPGSICTTRVVTGVGAPQLGAIMESAAALRNTKKIIIADGGIRYPGDIAKALGAGAHAVMLGNLLAGSKETPGRSIIKNGKRYKEYRGMGSLGVMNARRSADRYLQSEAPLYIPEGVEALVEEKESVISLLHHLEGALRSSFGYVGAATISEFHRKARFIRVSEAGRRESFPHSVFPY